MVDSIRGSYTKLPTVVNSSAFISYQNTAVSGYTSNFGKISIYLNYMNNYVTTLLNNVSYILASAQNDYFYTFTMSQNSTLKECQAKLQSTQISTMYSQLGIITAAIAEISAGFFTTFFILLGMAYAWFGSAYAISWMFYGCQFVAVTGLVDCVQTIVGFFFRLIQR